MSQKASPTLVGAFVLCGVVLAIGAVVVFGGGDVFKTKVPCVMYFDGNINGLTVGSQVKLRGVPVGSVIGIDMPIQTSDTTARIPVYAELTPPSTYTKAAEPVTRQRIEEVIGSGLRARLETESFVTGLLYIGLDLQPDEPAVLIGDAPKGFLEIPTLPPRIGEVVEKLMANLNDIDIRGMVGAIESAAKGVDDLVRQPVMKEALTSYRDLAVSIDTNLRSRSADLETTMAALRSAVQEIERAARTGEGTLAEVKELAHELRGHSSELVESVKGAAQAAEAVERRLESTLAALEVVIDPKAPLVEQLRATLGELAHAPRSLGAFARELQRNPSALVRGREVEGSKP